MQVAQPQTNAVPANEATPMEQVPANPLPDTQQVNVTNMGELVAPQPVQSIVCSTNTQRY